MTLPSRRILPRYFWSMVKLIIIAYSLFFILVIYCNNTVSSHNSAFPKMLPLTAGLTTAGSKRPTHNLASTIQGFWNITGEASAIFIIKNDRIIYPESEVSYLFSLYSDSMKIKHDDREEVFSVSMQGPDTLVLTGAARHVYSRFKDAAASF